MSVLDKCTFQLGTNGLNLKSSFDSFDLHFVCDGVVHFYQFLDLQKKFSKIIKDTSNFPLDSYVNSKCSIHFEDMNDIVFNILNHRLTMYDEIIPFLSKSSIKKLKKSINDYENRSLK